MRNAECGLEDNGLLFQSEIRIPQSNYPVYFFPGAASVS